MTTTISIPAIGTIMPDGSVFAGVSPDTGRPMYATPKDHTGFFGLKYLFTVRGAFAAASKLKAHGRNDWRVPSRAELNVLFRNRAAIGDFNASGSTPAGWYWSSARYVNDHFAWAQRFSDGLQNDINMNSRSALRCVRG
jgi:hypothetical protein